MRSFPDKIRGQAIISSAIARALDPKKSSNAEAEDRDEKVIVDALSDMLEDLSGKTRDTLHQAAQTRPSIVSVQEQHHSPKTNQTSLPQQLPVHPQQSVQPQVGLPLYQRSNSLADDSAQHQPDSPNVPAPSSPLKDASIVVQPETEVEPKEGVPISKVSLVANAAVITPTSVVPESGAVATKIPTGKKRKLDEVEEVSDIEPVLKKVDVGHREEEDLPEKAVPEKD